MKWPWQHISHHAAPENRATLTLLPTMAIIGLPHGTTEAEYDRIAKAVREWSTRGYPASVILPFPVDVVDRRTPVCHEPTSC